MRNVRKIENSLMRHPHSWQHCQRRSQPLFLEPLISKTNLNPLQASFHAAEHGLSIYYIRSRKSLHTLRYWTPFRKLFHVELREIRLDFLILRPRHLPIDQTSSEKTTPERAPASQKWTRAHYVVFLMSLFHFPLNVWVPFQAGLLIRKRCELLQERGTRPDWFLG